MSLKGDKYETTEEVRFRLEHTVVLYDGAPVYITRVNVPEGEDEIARVFFREMPYKGKGDVKEVRKYLSSRKFDLAPFRMGYMNHEGSAHFVSRIPNRQNKQGLSQATCKITDVRGEASHLDWVKLVNSQGFVDMVNDKFPSFKDAGDLLGDKKTSSVAVSRSFAFLIDHDLEALVLTHKGVRCGIATKGQKGLRLPPKYHFLKEEAEQCRIPLF